ncbi:hypothetical protein D3C76_1781480 [compost metagenome]
MSRILPFITVLDLCKMVMFRHSSSTCSIRWVENRMLTPLSRSSFTVSFNSSTFTGSRPLKASSRMISCGS